MTALRPMIRCREITAVDIEAVADLLARGFVGRSGNYWLRGLRRQATRDVPQGYPRFGYMLEHDGAPVGVLLLIYTARGSGDDDTSIWCNLSSWYVAPSFRNYAPMLAKIAQRLKHVTYVNISPARWTWPIIEAQGFKVYCKGMFCAVPALSRVRYGAVVEIVSTGTASIDGLPPAEAELLIRHASYGCLSLVVRTGRSAVPFVLQPVRIRRGFIAPPVMQLIYCRDIADFVASAGAIGRVLLRQGKIAVILDANGPVAGLSGICTEWRGRKYVRGPHHQRLGNLSDTELVLYGP
jgi:hypothetical protein